MCIIYSKARSCHLFSANFTFQHGQVDISMNWNAQNKLDIYENSMYLYRKQTYVVRFKSLQWNHQTMWTHKGLRKFHKRGRKSHIGETKVGNSKQNKIKERIKLQPFRMLPKTAALDLFTYSPEELSQAKPSLLHIIAKTDPIGYRNEWRVGARERE